MKIYLYILISLLISCSVNKPLQNDASICIYNDKILETDKTLNINTYKKELESNGYFILIENDSIEIAVDANSDGWRKYIINKNSDIEKHIIYDNKTLKIIKSFSFYKKGSFKIGNEYFYNEVGKIIRTIDNNQYNKYPICYKDIINNVLKEVNKKDTLHALYRDSIKIDNNKYKYVWNVYLDRSEKNSNQIKKNSFSVDAKTGEILKSWLSISTPD